MRPVHAILALGWLVAGLMYGLWYQERKLTIAGALTMNECAELVEEINGRPTVRIPIRSPWNPVGLQEQEKP